MTKTELTLKYAEENGIKVVQIDCCDHEWVTDDDFAPTSFSTYHKCAKCGIKVKAFSYESADEALVRINCDHSVIDYRKPAITCDKCGALFGGIPSFPHTIKK